MPNPPNPEGAAGAGVLDGAPNENPGPEEAAGGLAEGAGVLLVDEPNANVVPPPDADGGACDAGAAAEELPKEKAGAAGAAEPPLVAAACVDPNKAGVPPADVVESFFFSVVAGVAPKANGWAGAGAALVAGLPNNPVVVLLASFFFSVVAGCAPNENAGLAGVADVVAAASAGGLLAFAAPKANPGVPG